MRIVLALLCGCGFGARLGDPDAMRSDGRDRDGIAPTEFRRAIDIVDAKVTGSHAQFPLAVVLSGDWLRDVANGGRVAKPDGSDIRFTLGTQSLAHEIEAYSPANGRLLAWVGVPMLEPSTVIYVHYGDPDATPAAAPSLVWTAADYAGVWHLSTLADAAARNPPATGSAAPAGGKLGGGRMFGMDTHLDLGSGAAVDDVFAGGGSLEAWFNATSFGDASFGRVMDKGHLAGWSFGVNNNGPASSCFFVHARSQSYGHWNTDASTVALGTWHHVAVTYDRGNTTNDATIYVDGRPYNNEIVVPAGTVVADATQPAYAGNRPALDRDFIGMLDELRISSSTRVGGWFATAYANQVDPEAFYMLGPEE